MVEPQPSKLMTWVRFPLPAPIIICSNFFGAVDMKTIRNNLVVFCISEKIAIKDILIL